MTYDWSARVWLGRPAGGAGGSYIYRLTRSTTDAPVTTPAELAAVGGSMLLDGLTMSGQLPDTDLTPNVQPEPRTATFSIVATNVSAYSQLELGMPVAVRWYSAADPDAIPSNGRWRFFGRVADVTVTPHELGVLFTVQAVGYTADLAELTVGDTAYPAETVVQRLGRIFAEAGLPAPSWSGGIVPDGIAVELAARSASSTDALSLLDETMRQWAAPVTTGGVTKRYRYVVEPVILNETSTFDWVQDPANPWQLQAAPDPAATLQPFATLALDGTGHTAITVDTSTPAPPNVYVVDAGRVNRVTSWSQSKAHRVNNVVVTGAFGRRSASLGLSPKVTAQLDNTALTDGADALDLAQLYLPAEAANTAYLWSADAFTWELWAEPGVGFGVPPLGQLVTIARIRQSWCPVARTWYMGVLTGWTFALTDGQPRVVLQLLPIKPPVPGTGAPITFNSPKLAGVTINSLSSRDSIDDYRIVKG